MVKGVRGRETVPRTLICHGFGETPLSRGRSASPPGHDKLFSLERTAQLAKLPMRARASFLVSRQKDGAPLRVAPSRARWRQKKSDILFADSPYRALCQTNRG
jgi:hypothetical protein